MSVAGLNYHKFADQVAAEERVFTFTQDGELLVFKSDGKDTIPFWSSRTRLETTQRRFPKFAAYVITEMPLTEFSEWLSQLDDEGIQVGVNWSGLHLIGYSVAVPNLRAMIQYRLDRAGTDFKI